MKIISWNVNGIRAWSAKPETLVFLEAENPDIICFQETKAQPEQIEKLKLFPDYPHHYWHSAEKKGYSSTGIISKTKPVNVSYGMEHSPIDNEGRIITAEFDNYYLVTVYTPNSKDTLARLDLRYSKWDVAFLAHLKKLEQTKPVIVCGDLNVAHTPIDLARPDANKTTQKKPGSAGFTDQERERFDDVLNAGFIDTYRTLYPEKIQYTWWSYRGGARDRNVGWRIDYFLTSQSLKKKINDAIIYDQAMGSDHCPVGVEIDI